MDTFAVSVLTRSCEKEGMNRGAWTAMEDKILVSYIQSNGKGDWRKLPKRAGLKRCGNSCRLRWLNYLRPDIKRGNISGDEEVLIVRLHSLLGNRWSLIAGRLPGRTDNEIKNYWNTTLVKKLVKSSSTAAASSPTPRNSRATTKKGLSAPPSSNRSYSPPPTAIRPRVTRAKPNNPIDPPPPPLQNDNQTRSPSSPPSIPHAQVPALVPTSGDGGVGDLEFLDLGGQIFFDDTVNALLRLDDKTLEDWTTATYDNTTGLDQGKDMLDLQSLALFLDE